MMRGFWAVAACSLALLLFDPRAALADESAEADGSEQAQQSNPRGAAYGGVTLKGGDPPNPQRPPEGLQYVTWPGFRADKRGGAEVFLQLTGPVAHKVRVRGRRVDVMLEGVRVYLRNTQRTVITKHFPGPVARFRVRQLKGDRARLEITLSRGSKPAVSIQRKAQYTFLVVSFPPRS